MKKVLRIIVWILALVVIGLGAWFFVRGLIEADPGISAAVIGAVTVIAAGIWSHYSSRRRDINSRHFIEKKNAYMHLIDLIFDLFESTKNDKEIPEKEIEKRLFKFKKELMVWGDQTVIEKLAEYENKMAEPKINSDPSEQLLTVDDLLRVIRSDLGHNDSELRRGSLVGMLLIANDREKLILQKFLKGDQ